MPPAPGREHATDLLLCDHHYRASLPALAAARTVVFDMADVPVGQATALAEPG
jgi:hypothetical protein